MTQKTSGARKEISLSVRLRRLSVIDTDNGWFPGQIYKNFQDSALKFKKMLSRLNKTDRSGY
jgi:hypothetical protein